MSEDLKATPADFEIGDFSEATEPKGPFCVWHGYFGECPECKGSVERWTFTVVQASDHALVVDEAWTQQRMLPATWSGSGPSDTPPSGEAGDPPTPVVTAATGLGAHVPVAPDHVPLRVNPGLLARVRLLLGER